MDRAVAAALFCASMCVLSGSASGAAEAERQDSTATAPAMADPATDQSAATPAPYAQTIPLAADAPAPVATDDARPRPGIAEVIVTAQRREENLQDVPISITVLDQEQISNANMANSADLARYTPSLSANARFGAENATFTIRGFTQDLRTTASVGTYFADVVAPRGQSTQGSGDGAGPGTLFDLQNVQVLKGPQGTLFGRNTTGGAILIVPQKPTHQFEGYAELSGGDYDARRGQAVVNIPIVDSFRIRLGIDHNERDGHLSNVTGIGANELGDVDYTAGRFSAVWDVTDDLENYTIVTATNSDTKGYTSSLFACDNPIKNVLQPGAINVPELVNGLIDIIRTGNLNPVDLIPGVPLGSPFSLITFLPCQAQLARQQAAGQNGFYDLASSVADPQTMLKERRFINTTTWNFAESLTFKNILAYSHLTGQNESSIFGTHFPDPTDPSGPREFAIGQSVYRPDMPLTSQQTWIDEMRLSGDAFDSRLNWQAGLYYEHSTPDGYSGGNSASFIYCDLNSLHGDASQFNCFDPFLGVLGGVLHYAVKTDYLNEAAYAQGTFDVLDSFSVTLGMRYTKDTTKGYGIKTMYRYLLGVPQGPSTAIQEPEVRSSAPTGMFELNYHPLQGLMTYAKYTRGYRQGNVNMLADPGLDTHNPEYVNAYEIGMKSTFDWPIPARFNIAAFYNDLSDMQLQGGYISSSGGPTTAIFNAGKATSQGFEIESSFQLLASLMLNLSYSHLNTELVESADFCGRVADVGFLAGFSCTPIADVGDELPFAPKSAAVANLNWVLPFPREAGRIEFGVTYAYTGEQRVAATSSSPYGVLDDFGIVNLNFGWSALFGSNYDLAAYVTNVTDEQYVTFSSGTYRTLGFESHGVGTPRMFGARLRYNF